jgi:hypothetical protein
MAFLICLYSDTLYRDGSSAVRSLLSDDDWRRVETSTVGLGSQWMPTVYCDLGAKRNFCYVDHDEGLDDFEHALASTRAI